MELVSKEDILVELKAIFFVKDYDGDESYSYTYGDAITGGGRKVKVSFVDGELVSDKRNLFYRTSEHDLEINGTQYHLQFKVTSLWTGTIVCSIFSPLGLCL